MYIWMNILYRPKNILATLIRYYIHVDGIFLFTWEIFSLHGNNFLKDYVWFTKVLLTCSLPTTHKLTAHVHMLTQ
jgi:hypothetical protein